MKRMCKVCGLEKKKGISLFDSHICQDCQDEITKTDVGDTINYEFFKSVIKKIWIDYIVTSN